MLSICYNFTYQPSSFSFQLRYGALIMEEALLPASPLRHSLLNVAGFIEEKEWKGPFTFIQGADTQFGMIDSYIYKKKDPKWDKEIILTTEAIRKINCLNPKPRFFVICGDMLDAFPYRGEYTEYCNHNFFKS